MAELRLGMNHKVYETRSSNNVMEKNKNLSWSTEMDQCLAKILAEQVKQGYRVNNILKPNVFTTTVSLLNKKWGQEFTKQHIKNRLKTWKKQFGILNELLAQDGFEWNDDKQMVIASDLVWNGYLKKHPDARFLRSKVFENYDEFCLIIGKDRAIARNFENGVVDVAELAADDEDGIDYETLVNDKNTKNVRWTEEMDQCLGQILVQKVKLGYKVDGFLPPEAYDAALTALNEFFGPDLTRGHIKNRLKTWRKQYLILKDLLSHPEFKWDETKKMVIANGSEWDNYVKEHPDAKIFQRRLVKNPDDLWIIFGKDSTFDICSRNDDDLEGWTPYETVEGASSPQVQNGSAKERSKYMTWTQEMDNFLGKILVEQTKQGNNVHSNLKSSVSKIAVTALNKKFHLCLMKEHIRNRLRTWKKQYGVLKGMIMHSQFEWDDMRKMVTAGDPTWDYYIKIHPSARIFRGRVVENYDQWCTIFGDSSSVDSCSKFGNDVESCFPDDVEVLETSEDLFCGQFDNAEVNGKYIRWTYEMDRCLVDKLVEQVKLGNKLENILNPVAYTTSLANLKDKFPELTIENIRSRLKTWTKLYGLVKALLSNNGFEWDNKRKMVVANESAWNQYIEKYPDARFLRTRSIKIYDELECIMGNECNDQATGIWPMVCGETDPFPGVPIHNTPNIQEHHLHAQQIPTDEMLGNEPCQNDTQGSSQQTRARPSSSSRSKEVSRKRSANDVLVEMMSAMAENVGKIADALTNRNNAACLDELFEIVQNIPEFDDDLIIEACEYLSFDDKRAKMFMKLNDKLRKKWLLKRLRG